MTNWIREISRKHPEICKLQLRNLVTPSFETFPIWSIIVLIDSESSFSYLAISLLPNHQSPWMKKPNPERKTKKWTIPGSGREWLKFPGLEQFHTCMQSILTAGKSHSHWGNWNPTKPKTGQLNIHSPESTVIST